MFCKFCGNQLPDGSKFCTRCGARLDENQQNQNDSQFYTAQNYQPQYQQPSYVHREQNILAILGLVFAFVFTPVGLGLSIAGYRKAKELNGDNQGIALAGIIVSAVCLGLSVLILIPAIIVTAIYASNGYYYSATVFSQILGMISSIL